VIFSDVSDFRSAVAPNARLLGLDLGEKRIGLALSDTLLTVATPMEALKRGKFSADAARLDAIIADNNVAGLVIGLPLNMDGSEGPSAQSARAFARNFAARSSHIRIGNGERAAPRLSTRWRQATSSKVCSTGSGTTCNSPISTTILPTPR